MMLAIFFLVACGESSLHDVLPADCAEARSAVALTEEFAPGLSGATLLGAFEASTVFDLSWQHTFDAPDDGLLSITRSGDATAAAVTRTGTTCATPSEALVGGGTGSDAPISFLELRFPANFSTTDDLSVTGELVLQADAIDAERIVVSRGSGGDGGLSTGVWAAWAAAEPANAEGACAGGAGISGVLDAVTLSVWVDCDLTDDGVPERNGEWVAAAAVRVAP